MALIAASRAERGLVNCVNSVRTPKMTNYRFTDGPPMYKRQVSGRRGGGKNNRTFAFLGRILGPATIFFGFLEGFWTIF